MLYLAIISLTLLATATLYTLIKYSKNNKTTFLLIPMLIAASMISYTAYYDLVGTPIKGYPEGKFAVLMTHDAKPDIIVVVRHIEGPIKMYQIPFDGQNAATMNREEQLAQKGMVRSGEFKRNKYGEMRYVVDLPKNTEMPPKRVSAK